MVIIAAGVMAIISAFVNIGTGTSSGGILIGGILAIILGSIGLLVAYLVIQGIFATISTI